MLKKDYSAKILFLFIAYIWKILTISIIYVNAILVVKMSVNRALAKRELINNDKVDLNCKNHYLLLKINEFFIEVISRAEYWWPIIVK